MSVSYEQRLSQAMRQPLCILIIILYSMHLFMFTPNQSEEHDVQVADDRKDK